MQVKSLIFDSFDPILILSFQSVFTLDFDTNGIHEGAALWLFHFFVIRPAADAFIVRVTLKSKLHS